MHALTMKRNGSANDDTNRRVVVKMKRERTAYLILEIRYEYVYRIRMNRIDQSTQSIRTLR